MAKCILCGVDLEEMVYGHPNWNKEKAPYDFPICYDCLRELKKHLKEVE